MRFPVLRRLLKSVFAMTSICYLVACGGGGGGSSATSSTFSGFAGIGAPISGGTVTVIDSTGATVGTATTAADGSYTLSFNPANFTAPFVLKVTGNVGEAVETLVSVQPTTATSVINITPITHAISALLSSTGNPVDLITNIATEKSNITAAAIATNEQGFRDALASNLTAVGLTAASTNLISTTLNSNLDKLLDNVKVEVMPSGGIKLSTNASSAVDDLADSSATPTTPSQVVELAKGSKPTSDNAPSLKAPSAGEIPVGIDVLEQARLKLNACFAVLPSTSRSTATECTNLVTSDYLNAGRNATQEFSSLLSDSGNDLMEFQKPEIIRQLVTTLNHEKVIVRLSAKRIDGQWRSFVTVAENNHVIDTVVPGWKLVGDQRIFDTYINAIAVKRVSANTPANNRYETGFNLYVTKPLQTKTDNTVRSRITQVVVTGPGLPGAGITLKPMVGCDFLAIYNSATNTTPYCADLYRLRSLLTDGVTPFTPGANISYLYGSKSDGDIATIKPLDLYKFVITYYSNNSDNSTSTLTYWNRLRSRPLSVAEMVKVRFTDFDASTISKLTTGTMWTGGGDLTLNWSVPENAPSPYIAGFIHAGGSDNTFVSTVGRSSKIPCTGNTDCNGSTGAYNSELATNSSYIFQTVSRSRFDTQYFSQLTP